MKKLDNLFERFCEKPIVKLWKKIKSLIFEDPEELKEKAIEERQRMK